MMSELTNISFTKKTYTFPQISELIKQDLLSTSTKVGFKPELLESYFIGIPTFPPFIFKRHKSGVMFLLNNFELFSAIDHIVTCGKRISNFSLLKEINGWGLSEIYKEEINITAKFDVFIIEDNSLPQFINHIIKICQN